MHGIVVQSPGWPTEGQRYLFPHQAGLTFSEAHDLTAHLASQMGIRHQRHQQVGRGLRVSPL